MQNFVVAQTTDPECLERPINTIYLECFVAEMIAITADLEIFIYRREHLENSVSGCSHPDKGFKVIAQNTSAFKGYFLLEYMIDNLMLPSRIMSIERGLKLDNSCP